jgi:ribose transport system permease protein
VECRAGGGVSVTAFDGAVTRLPEPTTRLSRIVRRQGWTFGVAGLLVVLTLWRFSQIPSVDGFAVRTVTAGTMALAFLAMAQSVIVISGGIDLSVGAKMVLANCLSAMWMEDKGLAACLVLALAVVVITTLISTITGLIATVSGVPDIIVTLAASFSVSGLALFLIGGPGGGTSPDFQRVIAGSLSNFWPSVLWTVGAIVVISIPLRRSRTGLAIYAVGSDRKAAFLSGVAVARTRVIAYTVGGFLAGFAGIVVTASTGGGEPRATIGTNATLNSVAAAVLGGVALTGGVGGLTGPVLAALCLSLIPAIMLGEGWDPSNAETARGVIIILVVLVAGLLQTRRRRT